MKAEPNWSRQAISPVSLTMTLALSVSWNVSGDGRGGVEWIGPLNNRSSHVLDSPVGARLLVARGNGSKRGR